MVLPTIIGLILFIILLVLIGVIFTQTVITLLINGVLIYLILIRAWTELVKKARTKEYIIGIVVALLVYFIRGNAVSQLWTITTFLVIAFVVAEISHLFLGMRRKRQR
jgi:hypothetical protein